MNTPGQFTGHRPKHSGFLAFHKHLFITKKNGLFPYGGNCVALSKKNYKQAPVVA